MELHGIVKNKDILKKITPAQALDLLKEGNIRFTEKRPVERNHFEHITKTVKGQAPFAIVLSCIDSRVTPELIFDQGIGDIFVARIAGNIVNSDILGSMEYACAVTGSRLIVVMGHTSCGAVKGAIDNIRIGNLTSALEPIKPAVGKVSKKYEGVKNSANEKFVNRVAEMNVEMVTEEIVRKSPVLKELSENEKIDIIGAMYDHSTGKVKFGVLT